MNAHIYCVTNKVSGKQYVGQTVDNRKVGHGMAISEAYKKYGKEAFEYEKICTGIANRNALNYLERFWIATHNSIAPNGYNIETGGSNKGIVAESTKQKIREHNLGKVVPMDVRIKISEALKGSKNPFYGKTHSAEALAKISAANVGKTVVLSDEAKNKISIANAGVNNGMYGKKHTEEVKAKLMGRPSPKYWLGKKFSDSTRSKMVQAAKLRPELTCPHCSKTGGFNGMKVHHMDNCKVKDNK
jgi:group I intron endonuclease